jgi:hypothetical protein
MEVNRMKLSKSFTFLLGMMLLLSFGTYAHASAIDFTDFSPPSDGVTVKKLSQAEVDALMKRIILYEGPTRDINENNFIAAQASGDVAYVQFSELEKNEVAKSNNTLVLSKQSNVTITAVQWADSFTSLRSPDVLYILINEDFRDDTLIVGTYTHSNKSVDIPNVPKGKYYLMVLNKNSYTVSGNANAKRALLQ